MALPPYEQYLAQHAASRKSSTVSTGSGLVESNRSLDNQLKQVQLEKAKRELEALGSPDAAPAPKTSKLTPTQQGEIYGADDTLSGITSVNGLLEGNPKIDTGKSQALKGTLRKVFGDHAPLVKQSDQEQQLDALLGKLKSDYLKSFAGTNVTATEQERLTKFLPDITDSRLQARRKI